LIPGKMNTSPVDGTRGRRPQQASWAPGRKEAMNLRGQKVEMLVKPTTSVYAPFYCLREATGFLQKPTGRAIRFLSTAPEQVKIEFEGRR